MTRVARPSGRACGWATRNEVESAGGGDTGKPGSLHSACCGDFPAQPASERDFVNVTFNIEHARSGFE